MRNNRITAIGLCAFVPDGSMRFILQNSSSSNLVSQTTTSTFTTATNWHHVAAWWDLSIPKFEIYVEGSLDTSIAGTSGTIDYSDTSWSLGDGSGGGIPITACLANTYVNTAQTLNLGTLSNLQKFISGGNAVNLGASGATPTGTSPIAFFSGTVANFPTNKGTGGGFTLTNGSLSACSSNPP